MNFEFQSVCLRMYMDEGHTHNVIVGAASCHVTVSCAICSDHCTAVIVVLPTIDVNISILYRAQCVVCPPATHERTPGDVDRRTGAAMCDAGMCQCLLITNRRQRAHAHPCETHCGPSPRLCHNVSNGINLDGTTYAPEASSIDPC